MIDHSTIERVISTANIVEVVGDYVSLHKRGGNYIGLCPFHNEKTPSFSVSPSKGIFKCFGCGKGGDAVRFVMEAEQLDFPEAIRFLAKRYHIEIEEREPDPQEQALRNERESLMAANAYAQRHFSHTLHHHPDGQNIGMAYFRERGLQEHIVERFQLGYSLDQREAFTRQALHDGYSLDVLTRAGLTARRDDGSTFDRFAGRVMFPIHSVSGRVIAFGGRTLRTDKKVAKYQNSPESDIYHKSSSLYGVYFAKRAIAQHDKCYLVEGYTDVLSMHQAGIENVVASSGTSLTTDQIRLIKRFTPNLTVLYDGDQAGIKAALRGTDMVLEQGLNVKIVLLPDGEDPDSFARSHSAQELTDYIAQHETDFIRFKTQVLLREAQNDPIQRANLIADIIRTIAVIPDGITRSVYIKECAALMSIDEQMLHGEVSKQRRQRAEHQGPTRSVAAEANADSPREQLRTPTLPAFVTNVFCEEQERELVRFLIREGHLPLLAAEANSQLPPSITVGQYIIDELYNDDLEFQNLQYKKVFEVYMQLLRNAAQPDTNALVNHPDPDISQLAVDILTDRHALSRGFWQHRYSGLDEPDFLQRAVPKAIQVYKTKVLQMDIQRLTADLATAAPEQVEELLRRIAHLNSIKADMAHGLGRVVM